MSWIDRLRGILGRDAAPAGSPDPHAGDEVCPIVCEEALARVQEYLDGELEPLREEEVAAHFETCALCYPHLKLEESFREALHRLRSGRGIPDGLAARIVASLEAEGLGASERE